MDGTTVCPHCDTRFKISAAQLELPNGMVRCGHCQRVFDLRINFVSAQADRQLKLPILDEPIEPSPTDLVVLQPMTLAEQVAIVQDEEETQHPIKYRAWPWAIASCGLLLTLFIQAVYFFRVDLAARQPDLKPALVKACQILNCTVPLPQKAELLSIESSALDADPVHQDQIMLSALLRNRAAYALAFPDLELTLNDTRDQPIARRVFTPADYLPPVESRESGLLPNHEINLRLALNTASLKPVGYRLKLVYPKR